MALFLLLCGDSLMARAGAPTASLPGGTSLLTTLPAPVYESAPTVTGATRFVFTPVKAPSPMLVRLLFSPSKLAGMVPAPMFAPSPLPVSPTEEGGGGVAL